MAPHQTLENVAISALRGYARDERTHSAAQIKQIIALVRTFGFTNPLLINEQDRRRPPRLEAAKQLGMETVPCIRCPACHRGSPHPHPR